MYEFKQVDYYPSKGPVEQLLKKDGLQGWQIAAVAPMIASTYTPMYVIFLQREIKQE